jgi:hypothetical protein
MFEFASGEDMKSGTQMFKWQKGIILREIVACRPNVSFCQMAAPVPEIMDDSLDLSILVIGELKQPFFSSRMI